MAADIDDRNGSKVAIVNATSRRRRRNHSIKVETQGMATSRRRAKAPKIACIRARLVGAPYPPVAVNAAKAGAAKGFQFPRLRPQTTVVYA